MFFKLVLRLNIDLHFFVFCQPSFVDIKAKIFVNIHRYTPIAPLYIIIIIFDTVLRQKNEFVNAKIMNSTALPSRYLASPAFTRHTRDFLLVAKMVANATILAPNRNHVYVE